MGGRGTRLVLLGGFCVMWLAGILFLSSMFGGPLVRGELSGGWLLWLWLAVSVVILVLALRAFTRLLDDDGGGGAG